MKYSLRRPKWLARFLHFTAGKVAASSFKDVAKDGFEGGYNGIKIAANDAGEIETIKTVLHELKTKSVYSEKLICRWITQIVFVNNKIRWNHFCDGTVFIWTLDRTPNDVLATWMYRWAVQICLYKRWGHVEVLVNDSRCQLLTDRSHLRLMKRLACEESYVQYVEKLALKHGAKNKSGAK